MRILIAEDETIIRLDLRTLLEDTGVITVCAEARDGIEAVELARTTSPDLAILDVNMPRLGGIEAARRIYAERPIPIVMLTAYGERRLVADAVQAGAFAYLTKPYKETDLLPAIETAAARHADLLRARRELGLKPAEPVQPLALTLTTSTGSSVPLEVSRRPDGDLDVRWSDPDAPRS